MTRDELASLFDRYRNGDIDLASALDSLRDFPSADLGYARLDNHRSLRTGCPEVVYCAGKTPEQLRGILGRFLEGGSPVLATRATPEQWQAVADLSPELVHDPVSRTIVRRTTDQSAPSKHYIAVVAAGTSDLPVAEEAAISAEVLGSRVERIYDVGVAGLHRLLGKLDTIRSARAIVAVAGMEGALPSVLGGLVDRPIIAVPTSVGYGASFGGLAALLAMLNTCAAGVTVVNIDNGFGAGYAANSICRLQG
jgi:NCAIR mutase (PurE)-related protein